MSEAPDPQVETPAPVETPENPAPEAPEASAAPEVADEAPEASAEPAEATGEAPEAPAPKKSPVAQLQGRVGHLTRTLHEKDAELTQERQRREALEALLNGRAPEGAATAPVAAASGPAPGTPEFRQLVQTEAQKVAAEQAFVAASNQVFEQGLAKHGDDFKEAVTNLNVLGLMDAQLVEAAMATDAPADVIHYLGTDVDEAARIRALPAAKMGVELGKIASKLAAPAQQPQISRAPAPITPVGGGATVGNDIYDPGLSDAEYWRRRAASGAKYHKAS